MGTDDLVPHLEGAEAVVHLAWRFQPTHRPDMTWHSNVVGTRRVLEACSRAGVPTVVVASSLAAYSPVDHDDPVGEDWATDGASSAAYCRENRAGRMPNAQSTSKASSTPGTSATTVKSMREIRKPLSSLPRCTSAVVCTLLATKPMPASVFASAIEKQPA